MYTITKAFLLMFIIKWSGPDAGNLYFSSEMLAMLTHLNFLKDDAE